MGSKYSHVFAPIRIRGIDFKNRITLAPTTPVLSTEDGIITHEFVDWFRMFARGGTSVLYLGNCSIDLKEPGPELPTGPGHRPGHAAHDLVCGHGQAVRLPRLL